MVSAVDWDEVARNREERALYLLTIEFGFSEPLKSLSDFVNRAREHPSLRLESYESLMGRYRWAHKD